ncbi:DUF421 domain-containing protein [Bacillus suaedaesalsae]|uniref:DUF421 domain-containing protein n=1 Tax=Bacillus suaedaesalsae TaxID=2810349 RepID=A0ABS2DEL2_9BACI|nr:DUF421 domain-containing protein [Bacillus suaedaesalsae]MBM6616896.1 DUF421 domain-containing protein [Bacillus suaedaesalsae]
MDFLQSQESLTAIEWILRAVIAFFVLLLVAKVLGQRAIAQLRPLDFAIAIVVGNILAHPLSDERLGLKGSVITTMVLVILYLIGIWMILKFPLFRRLLNPPPITLVKNGEILNKGLKKARISIDVLLEELRESKVEDIKKVALAMWEANGNLSVFLDPKYEPLTPSDYQMQKPPFELPITIIKEGKINLKDIKQLQKDEEWVVSRLDLLYQTKVENVLLGTLDTKDNLMVFLYK